MSNTYSQCYFHLVFAVKNRDALIQKEWKGELGKYITGIVQNKGHKLLAIAARPDHIHILIGYNLKQLIPDLVEGIKVSTNLWIKREGLSKFKFEWQKGYGAFTYSRSQIGQVSNYILNQDEHHKNRPFKEEYLEILKKNEIDFKEEYVRTVESLARSYDCSKIIIAADLGSSTYRKALYPEYKQNRKEKS